MSDYPTSINLCDGKYTIIYDFATGQSECLRYGQPWRQLVGDKMVLACFDEIVRLRAELAKERNKLEMAEAIIAGDGALITGLKNDLAAAQLDAARYRWLRDKSQPQNRNGPGLYWYLPRFMQGTKEEQLDAAIDNATKEEGK